MPSMVEMYSMPFRSLVVVVILYHLDSTGYLRSAKGSPCHPASKPCASLSMRVTLP